MKAPVVPAPQPGGTLMVRILKVASVAALLFVSVDPARSESRRAPRPDVEELQATIKDLQIEQQSAQKHIEALEARILQLESGGILDRQSRLSDSSEAQFRGRGLSGEPAGETSPDQNAANSGGEVRKEPARSAAVEAVTRNEQGYFGSAFTIEPGISYSHFSNAQLNLNGFLALDAIFLGLISIDQTNSDVITSDITARYGTGRFQADVNVPYLY